MLGNEELMTEADIVQTTRDGIVVVKEDELLKEEKKRRHFEGGKR